MIIKTVSITYPFYNLGEWTAYTFTLKLWDVYNNSSTAYTEFVVAPSGEIAMNTLLNYPNPFSKQLQRSLSSTISLTSLSELKFRFLA
jgi:hypothetical protein